MNFVYLAIAIVFEVFATSALKQTEGFTRLWPSLLTIVGYGFAFYFLSLPAPDDAARRKVYAILGSRREVSSSSR